MDISRRDGEIEVRIQRGDELEAVAVSLYALGLDSPRSKRAYANDLGERATDALAHNAHRPEDTQEFIAIGEDADLVMRALAHLVLRAEHVTHPLTVERAREMHLLSLRALNLGLPVRLTNRSKGPQTDCY